MSCIQIAESICNLPHPSFPKARASEETSACVAAIPIDLSPSSSSPFLPFSLYSHVSPQETQIRKTATNLTRANRYRAGAECKESEVTVTSPKHERHHHPPRFWHTISKVRRSRSALRKFDLREGARSGSALSKPTPGKSCEQYQTQRVIQQNERQEQ